MILLILAPHAHLTKTTLHEHATRLSDVQLESQLRSQRVLLFESLRPFGDATTLHSLSAAICALVFALNRITSVLTPHNHGKVQPAKKRSCQDRQPSGNRAHSLQWPLFNMCLNTLYLNLCVGLVHVPCTILCASPCTYLYVILHTPSCSYLYMISHPPPIHDLVFTPAHATVHELDPGCLLRRPTTSALAASTGCWVPHPGGFTVSLSGHKQFKQWVTPPFSPSPPL